MRMRVAVEGPAALAFWLPVSTFLTFTFGGLYMRGTPLRAREDGGPIHGTRGVGLRPS